MMTEEERSVQVTITVAAQRTGLKVRMVERCIQRGLVSETLSEEDLADLRRVRRISELGVNLPGVEIILHMRRQIEALRTELAELEAAMRAHGTPRAPGEWKLNRTERRKEDDRPGD